MVFGLVLIGGFEDKSVCLLVEIFYYNLWFEWKMKIGIDCFCLKFLVNY